MRLMKRTINHVTYNTETAKTVSERRYEIDQYSETLYQNKQGAYFLVGSGLGPYAHTVHPRGNGFHGRPHTSPIYLLGRN